MRDVWRAVIVYRPGATLTIRKLPSARDDALTTGIAPAPGATGAIATEAPSAGRPSCPITMPPICVVPEKTRVMLAFAVRPSETLILTASLALVVDG